MTLRRGSLGPFVIILAACIVGFWHTPAVLGITDLDEGLYAACAREMARTGDWVTPRVNGEPFYEKPPLLYWLSALSIRFLGPSERAVRLPSALSATLLAFLTYAFGVRFLGRRAALIAATSLALSPMTVAAGRLATTDAALSVLLSASLFSAYMAANSTPGPRRWWTVISMAAAGLGTLAKGAPAVVLPLAILGLYQLAVKRSPIRDLLAGVASANTLIGLVFFAVIAAPWHIAAWHANGQSFLDEYIMRQHIGRFQGGDTAHHAPIWFFVPAFLAGFFPWSMFTAAALPWAAGRMEGKTNGHHSSDDRDKRDCLRFLLTWFGVVFVVFSLGGSKLVSYILPLYPAAALLAGHWLARATTQSANARPVVILGIASAVIVGGLFALLLHPGPVVAIINRYADRPVALTALDSRILRLAAWLVGILTLGLAVITVLALLRRLHSIPAVLAATMASFWTVVLLQGIPIAQSQMIGSLHALARKAGRLAGDGGTVVIALPGARRPSVLYYMPERVLARRAVIEVDPEDGGGFSSTLTRLWNDARLQPPIVALTRSDVVSGSPSNAVNTTLIREDPPYALLKLEPGSHGLRPVGSEP